MTVIGAGVGGLAAAVDLANRGASVTVLERGPRVGGKMREIQVGGLAVDSGLAAFRSLTVPFDDRAKIEDIIRFEVKQDQFNQPSGFFRVGIAR